MDDSALAQTLDPDGFYHVCFVVPDLEDAMDELTELARVTWGEPLAQTLGDWPYRIVFSDQRPHIELISSVTGSPWETDAPRFHHLGWWTSCLDTTAAAWASAGAQVAFDGRTVGRNFLYVEAPASGARLEAVADRQRPNFLAQWGRSGSPEP